MLRRYVSLLLLAAAGLASGAELGVLAPVLHDNAGEMRPAPGGGRPAPVLTRVREGKLYEALQREAAHGFTASMLELDELAMRVAGQAPGTTWLLLSQEEGGFARRGFWLKEGAALRWIDAPLVDLVVDAGSVADGSFEEIFAHELGHVMLRRLLPNLPDGYSRTAHHSFSITDQQTAFDEGWATHFQGLARRLTVNERLRAEDDGLEGKPFVPLWLSNLDRASRIDGMRRNWFVHRQVTPDGVGDAVARRDLSTLFDRARLKSAAQMLASEGVVATFFYRQLAPSRPVGAAPEQPLAVVPAKAGTALLAVAPAHPITVVPAQAGTPFDVIASRYEPMFRALHALSAERLTPETPLVPALAAKLSQLDPDEGHRFVAVLAETSYGALASPHLAAEAEALGAAGRFGDGDAFIPALKALRQRFAVELAAVQAHPELLAAHAGPAIWLMRPSEKTSGAPLFVDLNTAEREHLLALGPLDAPAAERALASRRKDGDFRSLPDFAARARLAPAAARQLEEMALAASRAGTLRRE